VNRSLTSHLSYDKSSIVSQLPTQLLTRAGRLEKRMIGILVRGNSHVELSERLSDEAAVVGSASSGIAVHNIHEFTYGARTTEGIKPSEMGDSAMPNTTHGGIPKMQ
jgi:hypothetical protein